MAHEQRIDGYCVWITYICAMLVWLILGIDTYINYKNAGDVDSGIVFLMVCLMMASIIFVLSFGTLNISIKDHDEYLSVKAGPLNLSQCFLGDRCEMIRYSDIENYHKPRSRCEMQGYGVGIFPCYKGCCMCGNNNLRILSICSGLSIKQDRIVIHYKWETQDKHQILCLKYKTVVVSVNDYETIKIHLDDKCGKGNPTNDDDDDDSAAQLQDGNATAAI